MQPKLLNSLLYVNKWLPGVIVSLVSYSAHGQGCCSGGAGSPIVGGDAVGVLQEKQMELALTHQYSSSHKFYAHDRDTSRLFNDFNSNYLYLRADYGLSKNLTLSVATGYFLNKSLIELNNKDTISSSGFGDLILFPRFNVYSKRRENTLTELTLGLGMKIPIGSHQDSNLVFTSAFTGDVYSTSPPTVQTTTGSNDFMFYSFFYREYAKKRMQVFSNVLYIKKGWNSLGQNFGDYASIGLSVGKSFGRFAVTAQVRGEWVGRMETDKLVDMVAYYNIDPKSTGSRKVFFVPQVSYRFSQFFFFVTSDIPLYQYLQGTQIGSQYQVTSGIFYRFMTSTKSCAEEKANPVVTPVQGN